MVFNEDEQLLFTCQDAKVISKLYNKINKTIQKSLKRHRKNKSKMLRLKTIKESTINNKSKSSL